MTTIDMKKVKRAYIDQRAGARKRNIPFLLTFDQWLNWWINSGHLDQRGSKRGQYCMCRFNDTGPYSLDNIYCDTHANNTIFAHKGKVITEETRDKLRQSHLGQKHHPESYVKGIETKRQNGILIGGMKGKKHTEETKQKMSAIQSTRPRKPFSEEAKKKMSESAKNRKNKWQQ